MQTALMLQTVLDLQQEAARHLEAAKDAYRRADRLVAQIKDVTGEQFVCNGKAWKIEHRSMSSAWLPTGNRDWIEPHPSVRFI